MGARDRRRTGTCFVDEILDRVATGSTVRASATSGGDSVDGRCPVGDREADTPIRDSSAQANNHGTPYINS